MEKCRFVRNILNIFCQKSPRYSCSYSKGKNGLDNVLSDPRIISGYAYSRNCFGTVGEDQKSEASDDIDSK